MSEKAESYSLFLKCQFRKQKKELDDCDEKPGTLLLIYALIIRKDREITHKMKYFLFADPITE